MISRLFSIILPVRACAPRQALLPTGHAAMAPAAPASKPPESKPARKAGAVRAGIGPSPRRAVQRAPLWDRKAHAVRRESIAKTEPAKRLAIPDALPYHRRRTGGRVVDGTALEMRRACKGSVGSNPTLSASALFEPILSSNKGGCRAENLSIAFESARGSRHWDRPGCGCPHTFSQPADRLPVSW